MKDRKYCIIVMDNTEGVEEDLGLIISEPLNIVNNLKDTVVLETFRTPLSPFKIKKALNIGNKRSFFIFEMDAKTCATHIDEEHLQEFLFGSLDVDSEVLIEEDNREFLEEFNNSELPYKYNEDELSNIVMNTESLYLDRHDLGFIDTLEDMFEYTSEQLAELETDLEEDKEETIEREFTLNISMNNAAFKEQGYETELAIS